MMSEKTPDKKRLKTLKLHKSSSSSYIIGDAKVPPKSNGTVDKSHPPKVKYNNSSSRIANKNFVSKGFASVLQNSNINQSLLYEDIMKLKSKINKLNVELSFLKSENRKKDEEIKKVEKFLESSYKFDDKKFVDKLKGQSQIIKLKDTFQKLQEKINETKDENVNITNTIKTTDINRLKNYSDGSLYLFREKVKEYKKKLSQSKEIEKELSGCNCDKSQFFDNHTRLEKILKNIESENNKIRELKQKLDNVKEKSNKIDEDKRRLLTYNKSIIRNNEKLLLDKKKREDFIMNKPVLLMQIKEFEEKAKDLENKEKQYNETINNIMYHRIKVIEKEKLKTERNQEDSLSPKILLYDSLIKESKERQKELIELFEYYNDFINQKENYEKMKKEGNNMNTINEEEDYDEKDDFVKFLNSTNSFNNRYGTNIDKGDEEKKENDEDNIDYYKYTNFKLLLVIMLNVKSVAKDKIENAISNIKPENESLEDPTDKEKYLSDISKEILTLIESENESDQKLLKDLLMYYFEQKYQNNKESFLSNITNDLIDKNQSLFDMKEDDTLLEKVKNAYSIKSNEIIEKIKENNKGFIYYKQLKQIFSEQDLYAKNDQEKKELFNCFIYYLKKNAYTSNKRTIHTFWVKDIYQFFGVNYEEENKENKENENENENNAGESQKKEASNEAIDNFVEKLKSLLNEKQVSLKDLIGESNIQYIEKDENKIPVVNITKLSELFKENGFNEDEIANINCFLYEENSEDINLNLIENKLN